jgi:hypothetical protein
MNYLRRSFLFPANALGFGLALRTAGFALIEDPALGFALDALMLAPALGFALLELLAGPFAIVLDAAGFALLELGLRPGFAIALRAAGFALLTAGLRIGLRIFLFLSPIIYLHRLLRSRFQSQT